MRIGIFINTAWNIYNFRRGIVKDLLSADHQMFAIAPVDDYVSKLEDLGCRFVPMPMSASGINPVEDLLLINRIKKVIQTYQIDLILTYTIKPNIYGSLVARRLGIPVICNVSGLGTTFIQANVVSYLARLLYKFSIVHADHTFFQNADDQQLFTSKVPLREGSYSLLNGSGVDLSYFQYQAPPENEAPIFLMIGRPMVEKGIYEYVEAARILKERGIKCFFQILGRWDKGEKRSVSESEMAIWEQEGILNYLGTSDDVRPVIKEVDAVILPSYREGTPRTLLEAGAMGKPLITTDVPGCRHVVDDGFNGFLCEPASGLSLANAIVKFLNLDDRQKLKMGENSRKAIEKKFDEKAVIESYNEIISRLGKSAS